MGSKSGIIKNNMMFEAAILIFMSDTVVIRPGELSDSEGIARVHTRSWQSAYRGLLPDELLDGLRWQERKVKWDAILSNPSATILYVASNSQSEIIGFANIGPCRDEDMTRKDVYELYAMYLSPEIWRTGVGAKLLVAAAKEIPDDFRSLSLWVLKENLQGRKFYESQGFKYDGTTKMANLLGYQCEEVRYRRQ